ncbi:MAG: SGNH/GDSL hydrolase family protein [Bacilli bacterium]
MKKITILFEGDSLTANSFEKTDASLGKGYPFISANKVITAFPNIEFVFFNEAVAGSKTDDVRKRLERELIKYQPDIVSLFIGVNDSRANYTPLFFQENYTAILKLIKQYEARLIVVEPYLCPVDIYKRYEARPTLIEFQEIIRLEMLKYADAFIPLDGLFFNAYLSNDPKSYFVDGLHLSPKGHEFIGEIHGEYLIDLVKNI